MIPKTVTASRITENLKATQIKLDTEDMERLKEVGNRNFRFLKVRSRNLSFLNCYTSCGYMPSCVGVQSDHRILERDYRGRYIISMV